MSDKNDHVVISNCLHTIRKIVGSPIALNVFGGGPLIILKPGQILPPDEAPHTDGPVVAIHESTVAGKGKTVIMA